MFEDTSHPAEGRTLLPSLQAIDALSAEQRLEVQAVAQVLPFRVNRYIVDELIDWDRIPDDPIFRLCFPHRDMLDPDDFRTIRDLLVAGATKQQLQECAQGIRARLNPHPAGQTTQNVPTLDGEAVPGVQHKYRETVLVFPSAGQTCHAYCSYCFRWPQFVGDRDLRFATRRIDPVLAYLRSKPEVSDVLLTGGDPLVMKTRVLARTLLPMLDLPSVQTIRIGTKSVAWWPQRFVEDDDADDLLRLFEKVIASGRHLALMAHYSHPRELSTPIAQRAIERIRGTGAVIRCQAPLVRHVNADSDTWAELWRRQVALGVVPYYMFVERDTGPRHYFEVPLAEALCIYTGAVSQVSGLARTARGPVMSCTPGKAQVLGTMDVAGEKRFLLRFLQARDPKWINHVFTARYDEKAAWLDHLRPCEGERFEFEAP